MVCCCLIVAFEQISEVETGRGLPRMESIDLSLNRPVPGFLVWMLVSTVIGSMRLPVRLISPCFAQQWPLELAL